MKHYFLSILALGLWSSPVQAETTKTCSPAEPFKLLTKSEAEPYQLTAIVAKTTSPYADLTTEESASQSTKNTENPSPHMHIVNFWAVWCAPCREELPLLDKLSTEKVAEVTLINVGDSQKTAEDILQKLNIKQLQTHLADSEILSNLSIAGLPASLLFAGEQQVYMGMGKLKDEDAIKQWLQCLDHSHSF